METDRPCQWEWGKVETWSWCRQRMRSVFAALLDHINIHIQDTDVIYTHCYLLDNHTLCHIYYQDTGRGSANICAMAGIARYSFSPVSYWYSSDYSHWEPLVITSWYCHLKAITWILILCSQLIVALPLLNKTEGGSLQKYHWSFFLFSSSQI